jgi:hypothetical protein
MNSQIRLLGIATASLGASLLAGCNAVSTPTDKTYVDLPKPTVVLQGTITGLGSKRSIVIQNGDNALTSFVADDPSLPTDGIPPTGFSFGASPQGATYNIIVKTNPYGKICTVTNGQGTITTAADLAAHPITVACVNDPAVPRYDVTVNLPNDPALFSGLTGATVNLKTEEQIYSKAVTSGQTSVTFTGAVFNAASQPNNGFNWSVIATARETDGSQTRCVVTGPTGTNPAGNVTTPRVGTSATQTQPACRFTISGSVAYSTAPAGTAVTTMPAGGMAIDVRDVQGNVLTTQEVSAYGAFTFNDSLGNPKLFPSNGNAVYDIAVSRQPPGQTCVVA